MANETVASDVKVAAAADIHITESPETAHREFLQDACRRADVLVLCGDLTNRGLPREAEALAHLVISHCKLPVVAVLGNHDYESGHVDEIRGILCDAGIVLLEDKPCEIGGVGFAGVKGFCGGFDRHALTPFGEDTIKGFVHETLDETLRLETALATLRTEHKIAVLHYAPVRDTVEGEPPEIYPFLGSSRMSEPIDRFGVTAVFHGHAHNGAHRGRTLGGVPVYNVALPIMQREDPEHPYFLLELAGH